MVDPNLPLEYAIEEISSYRILFDDNIFSVKLNDLKLLAEFNYLLIMRLSELLKPKEIT